MIERTSAQATEWGMAWARIRLTMG